MQVLGLGLQYAHGRMNHEIHCDLMSRQPSSVSLGFFYPEDLALAPKGLRRILDPQNLMAG